MSFIKRLFLTTTSIIMSCSFLVNSLNSFIVILAPLAIIAWTLLSYSSSTLIDVVVCSAHFVKFMIIPFILSLLFSAFEYYLLAKNKRIIVCFLFTIAHILFANLCVFYWSKIFEFLSLNIPVSFTYACIASVFSVTVPLFFISMVIHLFSPQSLINVFVDSNVTALIASMFIFLISGNENYAITCFWIINILLLIPQFVSLYNPEIENLSNNL